MREHDLKKMITAQVGLEFDNFDTDLCSAYKRMDEIADLSSDSDVRRKARKLRRKAELLMLHGMALKNEWSLSNGD